MVPDNIFAIVLKSGVLKFDATSQAVTVQLQSQHLSNIYVENYPNMSPSIQLITVQSTLNHQQSDESCNLVTTLQEGCDSIRKSADEIHQDVVWNGCFSYRDRLR